MKNLRWPVLAVVAVAGTCYAVETKFWQQTDLSDFEKGSLAHLSLRSDGRIYLAPSFTEVFESSTPYLWAIVVDPQGNVYTAGGGSGGGDAKLFVTDAKGKTRTVAELQGLEIHALAIDRTGRLYAATDPDGKVYRVPTAPARDGSAAPKPELFYDPHAKYIWALAFDSKGDLFVATGDKGEIHRVTPDGKGTVFFKTEETHARSLLVDSKDNLIVGTEPNGLVLRVSPTGAGFVLYQTPKREITAVAVASSGDIYAAGVGNRTAASPPPSSPPAPPPAAPAPPIAIQSSGASGPPASSARQTAPPSLSLAGPPISGGSEVYRINPDGSPRKVWSNTQDVVYAIGFDRENRPVIGTGNRGKIYRLDSSVLSTLLLDAPPTQITGFAAGPQGRLYVITGNIGKVYEIGPALASRGVFESDVLDAGAFSYWGRLSFRGTPANASIYTRTGNLNRPQDNWSPWAQLTIERDPDLPSCARCLNGRVASPPARFLQYKVELSSKIPTPPPEIASVEVAYLSKNFPPSIEEIEITPPNYRYPAPSAAPAATAQSLTLPPLGQKKRASSTSALDTGSGLSMSSAKGFIGARWAASDENGDTLVYTIEIRGVKESGWKVLKEKIREKYFSWDSTAFPDGEYEVRVTASDLPANPPGEALTAALVSDPFLIDNTPPQIQKLAATTTAAGMEVRWTARDARSIVERAEYSLNGADWVVVEPITKLSDAPEEEYVLKLPRAAQAEQTIAVRVTDAYDNQSVDKIIIR